MSSRAVGPRLRRIESGVDQKAKIKLRKPMSAWADGLSQPLRDWSGVDVSAEQFRTPNPVQETMAISARTNGQASANRAGLRWRAYFRQRPEATAGALRRQCRRRAAQSAV